MAKVLLSLWFLVFLGTAVRAQIVGLPPHPTAIPSRVLSHISAEETNTSPQTPRTISRTSASANTANAQAIDTPHHQTASRPTSSPITSVTFPVTSGANLPKQRHTSVAPSVARTSAAFTSPASGTASANSQSLATSVSSNSRSSGLSSSAKIGIGVGVGIGGALLAAAGAFLLIRRKRNTRTNHLSSEDYRDQSTSDYHMPPFAGMAAGRRRSSSLHSNRRADSRYSLSNEKAEIMPRLSIVPPSRQSLTTQPSLQHFIPAPAFDLDTLMPEQRPSYDDAPSPIGERSWTPEPHERGDEREAVSPVSPVSSLNSRPPSPIEEHDRR